MSSEVHIENETALHGLARCILDRLRGGDCLLLSGPVGAGKSALARAIIQAQMERDGLVEDVPSPTFTLVQTYETGIGTIWHADLYRLAFVDEIEELGLFDNADEDITLIEWPERLGPLTPSRHLAIAIEAGPEEDGRLLRFDPHGPGFDWVTTLAACSETTYPA